MTKPYYSDYVRHCMRFYARNTEKPHFNTEVDEDNWFACHKAIGRCSDRDKTILLRVYGMYDTIPDNVYEVSNLLHIDQNLIWDLMKDFERVVARKRGLL